MTQIYLIRHAEAEGNLYRRIQGWYNSLITDNGYRQIDALADRFRDVPIDAIYSSDLFRTMTTAGAILRTHDLPLNTQTDLREIHMGDWEDCPWAEIQRTYPAEMGLFNAADPAWRVPNGDSFQSLQARVLQGLEAIASAHAGERVAVFSHGTAIRTALTALHGLPLEKMAQVPHGDNTAVSLVEWEGGSPRVVFQNDASHLPHDVSTLAHQKWWKEEEGFASDDNLYYRPLDLKKQGEFYYQCRQDAWVTIHGSLLHFDGDGFLRDAKASAKCDPRAVFCAMLGECPAGLLQLDFQRGDEEKVGWIPFFYLMPEMRGKGIGVQLLGQAISVYRPMGREFLRLRCAPDNTVAQKFYAKYGFTKVGEAQGTRVPLDILQKYIGYHQN